jgi:hypothetical protein
LGDAGERFSVNDFLSLNKGTGAEMEIEADLLYSLVRAVADCLAAGVSHLTSTF